MPLGLGLGFSAKGGGSGAPSFSAPYDLTYIQAGDSRTALGGGIVGIYGNAAAPLSDSYSSSVGTSVDGYLARWMDNRIRRGQAVNFGIGGSVPESLAAYPRPAQNSSSTGSITGSVLNITAIAGGDPVAVGQVVTHATLPASSNVTITSFAGGAGGNGTYNLSSAPGDVGAGTSILTSYLFGSKTIADIAANPASMVILWDGTNDSNSSANLALALAGMDQIIRGLTDPTYSYPGYGAPLPLYNGLPKTILLFNETRRGVTALNASNQVAGDPADFAVYARTLMRYSFDSGNATYANRHVVAIDTFDDSRLANLADTTNFTPLPGFFADGLHPALPGSWMMAQIARDKLDSLIPVTHNYAILPDTTTASTYFNQNPCMPSPQTGGTSAVGTNTISLNGVLSSAALAMPSGWKITTGATGLDFNFSYNLLAGNAGYEMVLRITGTPSSTSNITLSSLASSAQRTALAFTSSYTLRGVCNQKIQITAGSVYACYLQLDLENGSATNAMVSNGGGRCQASGYGGNALYPLLLKNPNASAECLTYKPVMTNNVSLAPYVATGTPSAANLNWVIAFLSGVTVDVTLTISQHGIAKVTD